MTNSTTAERATLTLDETAKALGVSRATIYRMLRAGRLSAIKVRRRTLIPTPVIAALVASAPQWRAAA